MAEDTTNVAQGTRRGSERIDARIQVQFRSGQEFARAYTQNISRGGIYLETKILPDPNATVEVAFDLPSAPGTKATTLTLRGKVVRLMTINLDGQTVHKVAVQFIEMEPQVQAQLDSLYNQLSK